MSPWRCITARIQSWRDDMKRKLILFLSVFAGMTALLIGLVIYLDPFFLYHAPRKNWYYRLANERSQSIGIAGSFDYDALIVGSSLIRDIRTSRFDELFGTQSVKLPISGATWHETGEVIRAAYQRDRSVRIVLRPLDVNHLIEAPDLVRWDLGEYPYYLYDKNRFNDVRYVCNRDILFSYCFPMVRDRITGVPGGHTSFDSYGLSHTGGGYVPVMDDIGVTVAEQIPFTDEDAELLKENLTENLFCYSDAHPETEYILYLPPYNVVWWSQMLRDGTYDRTMAGTELAAELLLSHANIRLYCYDDLFDLTDDLTQYADEIHYSSEITHRVLEWIAADEGRLTKENMAEVLKRIREYYRAYDYADLLRRVVP